MRYIALCSVVVALASASAGGVVILTAGKVKPPDPAVTILTFCQVKLDGNEEWQLPIPPHADLPCVKDLSFGGRMAKSSTEGASVWFTYLDSEGRNCETVLQTALPRRFLCGAEPPLSASALVLHVQNLADKHLVLTHATLRIVYSPTPEPATLGLMGLCCVAVLWRRRA